jgi:hypothetical protein
MFGLEPRWRTTSGLQNESPISRGCPLPCDFFPASLYLVRSICRHGYARAPGRNAKDMHQIDWVIAGGESGHHARPMDPVWLRPIRDQCVHADVPFHFKQWGDWSPDGGGSSRGRLLMLDGGPNGGVQMTRVGKRAAGRRLDGRLWDGLPESCARISRSSRTASGRR